MIIVPTIIPITNTVTRDCIIQEGVRYCEGMPLTKHDIGIGLASYTVLILWGILFGYVLVEKDNVKMAAAIFFTPFIIGIIWAFL